MSITLDTLTLPDDCVWANEFDALPVAAAAARTVSGRLVVAETYLTAGRPIDLGGENAWLTRADVTMLVAWAGTPGWRGLLTLHDGRAFTVRFRTQEEKSVEVVSLLGLADPEAGDLYQLTALRLETVA
jgi:hypothetical protein